MSLRSWIKKQLKDYQVPLNSTDKSLKENIETPKKVAVIGAGLAGISAASNLAEKGFKVDLYEKASFLGGKVGSWQFTSNNESLNTEHGFHAFFHQYYNLLNYIDKIGASKNLKTIKDYVILFDKNKKQGFKEIDKTPGINIIDLKRFKVFSWLTLISPFSIPFLDLLRYDSKKTFARYDNESFEQFANRTFMPKKMRMVFNSFARAFFAEPKNMSMAELIKAFHFYYLSNDKGLLYDYFDDDFKNSFLKYSTNYLKKYNVQIKLNTPVDAIFYEKNTFQLNNEKYDYCVLCTDVNATKRIINQSKGFETFSTFNKKINSLKNSGNYAVLRLWTNIILPNTEDPCFIFTDRVYCLDSVTFYHKMEKESIEWSKKNKGGIYELHSYSVPENLSASKCKESLLKEFVHYFPEMKEMKIIHEYYQFRDDFTSYAPGLHKLRPKVKTEVPNLFLAGDWVKMNNSSTLMEAAYLSGAIAANFIIEKENVQQHELIHVPLKGIFA